MWTEDTLAERQRLIDEGNRLRVQARALAEADRVREAFPLEDRITALRSRYQQLLPEVTVARCPHSGALVRWPIDTAGLDGWFWRYEGGARRPPQSRPRLWLAMPGAVRLSEPVEHTPYRVMPGPGAPFVVPRILLVNLWGQDTYPVYDDNGIWTGWDRDVERVHGYDFELAHWLRVGKLLWIEPGDESGALREGVHGCPHLDVSGPRKLALVQEGKVWYFA